MRGKSVIYFPEVRPIPPLFWALSKLNVTLKQKQ